MLLGLLLGPIVTLPQLGTKILAILGVEPRPHVGPSPGRHGRPHPHPLTPWLAGGSREVWSSRWRAMVGAAWGICGRQCLGWLGQRVGGSAGCRAVALARGGGEGGWGPDLAALLALAMSQVDTGVPGLTRGGGAAGCCGCVPQVFVRRGRLAGYVRWLAGPIWARVGCGQAKR